jgi:hypothetical protein
MPSRALAGAYASLAEGNGIALYGSADALREVASLIRLGASAEVGLSELPEEDLEVAPLRTVRVRTTDQNSVDLTVAGDAIEIVGGTRSLEKLADTLENLAEEPAFGGEVLRHVDLEYFPGHGFLSEESTWMTVILLPVLST